MTEESPSIETQLAVIRTKLEQLVELSRTRGEDHETRIRGLEDSRPDYITKRAAQTLIVTVCIITTASINLLAYLLR